MCTDLETQADSYANFIVNKDFGKYTEYISPDSLKNMLAEAFRQGAIIADALTCCDRGCFNRKPPKHHIGAFRQAVFLDDYMQCDRVEDLSPLDILDTLEETEKRIKDGIRTKE